MKKYRVVLTVDATIFVEVDAENEAQAKELGLAKASMPHICHQCSRNVSIGDVLDAVDAEEI